MDCKGTYGVEVDVRVAVSPLKLKARKDEHILDIAVAVAESAVRYHKVRISAIDLLLYGYYGNRDILLRDLKGRCLGISHGVGGRGNVGGHGVNAYVLRGAVGHADDLTAGVGEVGSGRIISRVRDGDLSSVVDFAFNYGYDVLGLGLVYAEDSVSGLGSGSFAGNGIAAGPGHGLVRYGGGINGLRYGVACGEVELLHRIGEYDYGWYGLGSGVVLLKGDGAGGNLHYEGLAALVVRGILRGDDNGVLSVLIK